jgi:hypothetical protein
MIQGYCIKEVVKWALNYIDSSNPISFFKSHHDGRITEKGIIEKKVIAPDPNLFCCAHFHVLQ